MIQRIKRFFKELDKSMQKELDKKILEYKNRPFISLCRFRCVNCKYIWEEKLKKGDKPFSNVGLRGSYIRFYTDNPENHNSGDWLKCPFCEMDECIVISNQSLNNENITLIKDSSIKELSNVLKSSYSGELKNARR